MKQISPIIYIGGAAALYFLFLKPGAAPGQPGQTVFSLPGAAPQGSTAVGINMGQKGANGVIIISNYAQLAAANPNLLNPSYQMTPAENSQYLANYLDLQQGLPSWIGKKQPDGTTPANISQAAQSHWHMWGCAEKRVFLPLQPPSTVAYVPPPPAPKSSGGGSFLSGALGVVTSVLPLLLGPESDPTLNDADIQLLFTAGAILNDILPLYNTDPMAGQIHDKLTDLLTQYS